MPVADSRPVGELVHGDVLLVTPDVSVRDAVIRMTEQHVSYALISLPDGEYGIFTDRDLRTRVVAAGLSVDVPITRVMSAPARRVTADLTAETVLMSMLESGLRHMPVTDGARRGHRRPRRRRPAGRLGEAELHAAALDRSGRRRRRTAGRRAARHPHRQRAVPKRHEGIRDERHPVDRDRQRGPAGAGAGTRRGAAGRGHSDVGLRVADPRQHRTTRGHAVLGRRQRAVLARRPVAGEATSCRAIARRTHAILDGCGLPSDSNGAVASSPNFSRSQSDWARAARGWLDDPLVGKGLILSSLLLDGRVVWGETALHTVPAAYRRMRAEHPNALRLQLLDALSGRVRDPVAARRAVASRRHVRPEEPRRHADREPGAVGRAASVTSRRRRPRRGSRRPRRCGALSERDAATLGEVFVMLQRLRMTHQVEQLVVGHSPGDVITMSELSPLNRSLLNDGLREIAAVQRRVGNFGIPAV